MPVEVLCVGHAVYDITMYLSSYPAENGKWETFDSIECGGGPAANAAYLLGMWGVKTAFAGMVGDDLYAQAIRWGLRDARVNTSLLEMRPCHATPLSTILVNTENGSRTVINRKSPSSPYHPDPEMLAKLRPGFLLFDGHELEASLAALKAFPDAVSVLDAGSLRPGTEALVSKVDYLVASERFACQVAGMSALRTDKDFETAINALLHYGPGEVAITLGERGYVYADGESVMRVTTLKVEAIDTTGAGDVFHGGFVYGLVTGRDFKRCLRVGCSAAALSVTKRGGRTSIPTIEQLNEFLATSPEQREA